MSTRSVEGANRKCCVEGCPHTEARNPELHFYGFPNRRWEVHRKELWINAANRTDNNGEKWRPKQYSRVCSAHFVQGQKSNEQYNPSYVPTIFPNRHETPKDRGLLEWMEGVHENRNYVAEVMDISDIQGDFDDKIEDHVYEPHETQATVGCQTEPYVDDFTNEPSFLFCWQDGVTTATQTQIHVPCVKVDQCCGTDIAMDDIYVPSGRVDQHCGTDIEMNPNFLGYSSLKTDLSMRQLAGVSYDFFMTLLTFVVATAKGQPLYYKKVSRENRLLLFLMKMKLGISHCALGCLFGVSDSTARQIFFQILHTLSLKTRTWIFWPSKESVRKNLPSTFHQYTNCRCIIDCSEIRTETPPTVEQRALMYSNYKGSYTVKFLLVITPDGFVCKVSKAYGGRATDSYITNDSGFLNLIEPGDLVLADKGFPQIKSELSKRNSTLVIPPFAFNPQFTEEEIDETYKIASVRIHVELAIQRIKILRILDHFSVDLFPHIDAIMHMCCVIANSRPPLFRED